MWRFTSPKFIHTTQNHSHSHNALQPLHNTRINEFKQQSFDFELGKQNLGPANRNFETTNYRQRKILCFDWCRWTLIFFPNIFFLLRQNVDKSNRRWRKWKKKKKLNTHTENWKWFKNKCFVVIKYKKKTKLLRIPFQKLRFLVLN